MLNSRQLRKLFIFDEDVYFDPINTVSFRGGSVMGVFLASVMLRKLMAILVHCLIVKECIPSGRYSYKNLKFPVYDRDYRSYFDSDICFAEYHELMKEELDSVMRGYGWEILESYDFYIEESDMSNYIDDEDGVAVERNIRDALELSGFSDDIVDALLEKTDLKLVVEGYFDSSFLIRIYTNNRLSNYLLSEQGRTNVAWNEHIITMLGMINHENMVGAETFWLRGKLYFLELQTSYYDSETGMCKEGGAHNVDFRCIADFAETDEVLTRYGY